MSKLKKKCQEYFDSTDFYEIFDVPRDATEKQIKKAYHRLSLLVHPDRVEKRQQAEATEKFKVLGQIHTILHDKNKRAVYDETGTFDEDGEASSNWMDYWRNLFKPISIEDIKKYEWEYIGSESELRDIKKAYEGGKGSMNVILEQVPFSNCDSEERIISIVRRLVDSDELPEYKRFFNEPKASKLRRRKKYEKEREESERIQTDDSLFEQIQKRQQERGNDFFKLIQSIEDTYDKKKGTPKGSNAKRRAITDGESGEQKTKARRTTRWKDCSFFYCISYRFRVFMMTTFRTILKYYIISTRKGRTIVFLTYKCCEV